MDRKDIYEHLAKIYLDASSKRKKKTKSYSKIIQSPFFIGIITVLSVIILFFVFSHRDKSSNSEIALLFSNEAVKINFNFDPAKKEIYSINLNKSDLSRFKTLGFSLKKNNYQDNISLKVEFANTFKEKSEIYLKNIPHKWRDYKITLSNFKNISNWSEMSNLSFIIEEWNTRNKKDVVYIDNIRLLR